MSKHVLTSTIKNKRSDFSLLFRKLIEFFFKLELSTLLYGFIASLEFTKLIAKGKGTLHKYRSVILPVKY